jgi:hypothetical protein
MPQTIAHQIDELYQAPLAEFVEKRKVLAQNLSGPSRRIVQALPKPTLPMWAINQLFWQRRSVYDALIEAAERLRTAHRSVLQGRAVDLRKPSEAHRAAIQKASKELRNILATAGHPATAATMETAIRTLEALPVKDEAPGRLSRPLQAAGFDLLAGIRPRPALHLVRSAKLDQRPQHDKKRDTAVIREQAARKSIHAAATQLRSAQEAAKRAAVAAKNARARLETAKADEVEHRQALDRAIQRRVAIEREADRLAAESDKASLSATQSRETLLALQKQGPFNPL